MTHQPKFPKGSSVGLLFSLLSLGILGHISQTHCAFGFGGFQCTDPFVGLGSALLLMALIAMAACLIFLVAWALLVGRWMWLRGEPKAGATGSTAESTPPQAPENSGA